LPKIRGDPRGDHTRVFKNRTSGLTSRPLKHRQKVKKWGQIPDRYTPEPAVSRSRFLVEPARVVTRDAKSPGGNLIKPAPRAGFQPRKEGTDHQAPTSLGDWGYEKEARLKKGVRQPRPQTDTAAACNPSPHRPDSGGAREGSRRAEAKPNKLQNARKNSTKNVMSRHCPQTGLKAWVFCAGRRIFSGMCNPLHMVLYAEVDGTDRGRLRTYSLSNRFGPIHC